MYKITTSLEKEFDAGTVYEIHERLGRYLDLTKTFIIEEPYIDRYWREEYSIHYSKTFYPDVDKFSTRVHMLKEDISRTEDVNEGNYLGYFVLRPIPIRSGKISRIIVKPLREVFNMEGEELYIPASKFKVHIGSKKLDLLTFPFYQQDSTVVVCAHADILMVTEYMHRKFNLNKPSIKDLILYTLPIYGRSVPSIGLTLEQISVILNQMGYPVSIKFPFLDIGFSDASFRYFMEYIDSYLESGLPTILAVKDHVISVVGHTLNISDEKDYIVYDDSGALLGEIKGDKMFCARVSCEELKDTIGEQVGEDENNVALINVEFERMYFPFGSVKWLLGHILGGKGLDLMEYATKKRVLVSDSNSFKIFCSGNGIAAFNDLPLPHYIWVAEVYMGDKIICDVVIDASAHKSDLDSWIAIWFENKIVFNPRYKPDEVDVEVRAGPSVYGNLDEF